jgi:hypothetical protein
MSEKKKTQARRGFLGTMLGSVAAAMAGTAVVAKAAIPTPAVAPTIPNDVIVPTFDNLWEKLKSNPKDYTKQDCLNLAREMNASNNATKIMLVYSDLQKNQRVLVKVHNLVVDKILHISDVQGADERGEKRITRLRNLPKMDGNDRINNTEWADRV